MIPVQVGFEIHTTSGEFVTAWSGSNVFLDEGKSGVVDFLRQTGSNVPRAIHFGTASAEPLATDTALGAGQLGKHVDVSAIGASGFTARFYALLLTGDLPTPTAVTEMLLAVSSAHNARATAYAKALVLGGTGIIHAADEQATFFWDIVATTGEFG